MATGNFLQNNVLEEIWHGVDGCRVWLGTKKEYIFKKGVIPNDTLICFTDNDDFDGVTLQKITISYASLTHNYNDVRWSPYWKFTIGDKTYTEDEVSNIVNIVEQKQTNVGTYKTTFQILDPTKYIWDNNSTANQTILWNIVAEKLPIPTLKSDEVEYTGFLVAPTIVGYDNKIMRVYGQNTAIKVGSYILKVKLMSKSYMWDDGTTNDIPLAWTIVKHTIFDVNTLYFDDVHKKRTETTSHKSISVKSATANLVDITNDYDDTKKLNKVTVTSKGTRGVADYVFSTPDNAGLDTAMKIVVDYPVTDIIDGVYDSGTNVSINTTILAILDDTYGDSKYNDTIMDIVNGGYST